MSESKAYDMIVIGGGPAGITAATTASGMNHSVAIIDNHSTLGGAGINTGTVPSKTLRETALAFSGLRSRNLYGVDLSLRREVTVQDFLGHEEAVRDGFHNSVMENLKAHQTDILWGNCVFEDGHTIRMQPGNEDAAAKTEEVTLRGDKIIIATGSSPVHPSIFDFSGEVYDSDTILKLDRIPKSMAVIGAGVIGAEYACTFRALGTEVHIFDGRDVLLPFLDHEVSQALVKSLERSGIIFHWKQKVKSCTPQDGLVRLDMESGETISVDAVLVAAGRQSNTGNLGLDQAGVKTGERGVIPVNEHYQTNVEHIYAAGDVIGFPALASTSMEQARRAVCHAFGKNLSALSPILPNGIYTIPEVSMIGETEESMQKKGQSYVVGRASYQDNARGRIIGDEDGFLKLIFTREGLKLVGVHIMGELATEVVHIGLIAMMCGAAAELFVDACLNTPTLGLLYKRATLDALEKIANQQEKK